MADTFGGLGGLGGFDFGSLFGALGASLLTSPRTNMLQNLPAGIQMANKATEDAQSRAAMAVVAQKLGIDPRLAANPQAMSLFINAQNQQQNLGLAKDAMSGVDAMFPGGGGGTGTSVGGPAPTGIPQAAAGMPKFAQLEVAKRVADKLVQRGIEPIVAAGIAGQTGPESGGNPGAIGDNGTAFGIIQARGDRAAALNRLAAQHGKSWKDEDVQVEHIVQELNGPERAAYEKARQAKDAGQAAFILAKHYERPAASALASTAPARMALAQQVYGGLGGLGGVPAAPQAEAAPLPPARGVQTAQADTGTATDAPAPYKVAAAGALPVPLRNVPDVAPPHPATAGDGTTTQRAYAQSMAKYGMKQMILGGVLKNEGLTAAGKAAFGLAQEYLKPTEMDKLMDAAGLKPAERQAFARAAADKRPDQIKIAEAANPGDPQRATEQLRNSIQDTRPEVTRLGQAEQDTPGLNKSGREALAAQKSAETAATERSQALSKESETATTSGRSAVQTLATLRDAKSYFKEVAEAGGTGPLTANPIRRAIVGAVNPESSQAFKNEVLRSKFDNAIAAIKNEKTRMTLSGQGPVSNFERVIAAADVPDLRVVRPEVGYAAFDRLERQIQAAIALDKELGLHQGKQPGSAATSGRTSSGHTWSLER